jgi:hypothetical protein
MFFSYIGQATRASVLLLGGFLWLVIYGSCGTKLKNTAPGIRCDDPVAAARDEMRPHFVTRQLTGDARDGASVLYRLDSNRMIATPVVVRGSDSTDNWAMRMVRTGQLNLLERFSGSRNSRLTKLGCASTGDQREIGSLPANSFGLGYLDQDTIVALGWDKAEVTKFSADFVSKLVQISPVKLAESGNDLEPTDRHFNSALIKDGRLFVLSTGYDLVSFRPAQSKIVSLNPGLDQVETVTEVLGCFNAYQEYTFQTSATEVIAGCNPQFKGDNGKPVVLVSVAIDGDDKVVVKELVKPSGQDTRLIIPAGVSADQRWLFVNEETVTEESIVSPNPGVLVRSYWLNRDTLEQRPMDGIGGRMVYDSVEENYVFSCRFSELNRKCEEGGFVVVKAADWDKPQAAVFREVQFDYDFYQFERPVY